MKTIYAIGSICNKIKKSEPLSCKEKHRPLRKDELYGIVKTPVILEKFHITDKGWELLKLGGVDKVGNTVENFPVMGVHKEIASQVGLSMIPFVNNATTSLKKGFNSIGPVVVAENHIYWIVLPEQIVASKEVNVKSWCW